MKVEMELDYDSLDQLVVDRLIDALDSCRNSTYVGTHEVKEADRAFDEQMAEHLVAVINYFSPPELHVE